MVPTQMLTTRSATVILYKGGHHLANSTHTVCGFEITDRDSVDNNILGKETRISCLYCARMATHPMNVER